VKDALNRIKDLKDATDDEEEVGEESQKTPTDEKKPPEQY
jgi:hypothetical protein